MFPVSSRVGFLKIYTEVPSVLCGKVNIKLIFVEFPIVKYLLKELVSLVCLPY
jgi:hypothetical protein